MILPPAVGEGNTALTEGRISQPALIREEAFEYATKAPGTSLYIMQLNELRYFFPFYRKKRLGLIESSRSLCRYS